MCCGWKSLPGLMFRASVSGRDAIRRSCVAISWRCDERLREEPRTPRVTDDPHLLDPEYDKHGGFPNFKAPQPGPGFAPVLTAMRKARAPAGGGGPPHRTPGQGAR